MAASVLMPKLGLYTDDVLLVEWLVAEGAEVRPGDALFVLETEKTTAEVEAEQPGFVHRLVPEGRHVPIGVEVGLVAATREEYAALCEAAPVAAPAAAAAATAPAPPPALVRPREGTPISPRARALLAREGVPLEDARAIAPSSAAGRITDRDVRRWLDERRGAGGPAVSERIALRGRRGTIAARLVQSLQTSAQLTSVLELEVSRLVALRRETGAGYTAIFTQLAARALRDHPLLNARIAGDAIELFEDVNVGVAVDTEDGLIVPVVHGADRLALAELDARIAELAARARAGTLAPADVAGGTFTLSNGGIHAVDLTTAILDPPQVALLWLGRIRERPVVLDGALAVRPTLQACLTYDHRAVDGAPAAAFLGTLERLAREPG